MAVAYNVVRYLDINHLQQCPHIARGCVQMDSSEVIIEEIQSSKRTKRKLTSLWHGISNEEKNKIIVITGSKSHHPKVKTERQQIVFSKNCEKEKNFKRIFIFDKP